MHKKEALSIFFNDLDFKNSDEIILTDTDSYDNSLMNDAIGYLCSQNLTFLKSSKTPHAVVLNITEEGRKLYDEHFRK